MALSTTTPHRQMHYMGEYASDSAANSAITGVGLVVSRGMLYYNNSSAEEMRVFNGTSWDSLATGGPSPWQETGTLVELVTTSNTVAIGSTSSFLNEKLYVLDTEEVSGTRGMFVRLEKDDGSSAKASWDGLTVEADHDGDNSVTSDYTGIKSVLTLDTASVQTLPAWGGYQNIMTVNNSATVTTSRAYRALSPNGTGAITTAYGLQVDDQGLSSTTAYGVFIDDQTATTAYGLYQAGADDLNVLLGDVAIGSTSSFLNEKLYVLDTDESNATRGMFVRLEKDDGASAKTSWDGLTVEADHDGDNSVTSDYTGIKSVLTLDTASVQTLPAWGGYQNIMTVNNSATVTTSRAYRALSPNGTGTITTAYGLQVDDQGLSSTTAYGIYVAAQTASGTSLGLYVDDDAEITGKLTVGGLIDPTGLVLEEQSTRPYDPTATTQGTIWVRDDNPNTLIFTDNAGNDNLAVSPWTQATGFIYLTTTTDSVVIGDSALTGSEKLKVDGGDILVEGGNINIPDSNTTDTAGVYEIGGVPTLRQSNTNRTVFVGNTQTPAGVGFQENSVIIGDGALTGSNANQDDNVVIGVDALQGLPSAALTDGTIAIGYQAAQNVTDARNSIYIGKNAAQGTAANFTGSVIIGEDAVQTPAFGVVSNVTIGYNASPSGGANQSVVIGANATGSLTFPSDSVYIGYAVAGRLENSSRNVAVGRQAMRALDASVGSNGDCVAIGYRAMYDSTSGSSAGNIRSCVAIGSQAMFDTRSDGTAQYIIAIGRSALYDTDTSSSSDITGTIAIGVSAGRLAYDSEHCVYIGRNAGRSNNSNSNRLFIHNSSADVGTNALLYGGFDSPEFLTINGRLILVDTSTRPPLNVTERSAAPTAIATGDIYLDDGSNTASGSPGWRRWDGSSWEDIGALGGGGSSPWTSAAGVIYPATLTDDVAIGSSTLSSTATEKLYIFDDDETASVVGGRAEFEKDSTGTKSQWVGWVADVQFTGAGDATTLVGFDATATLNSGTTGTIDSYLGFIYNPTHTDGTFTSMTGFFAQPTIASGQTTDNFKGVSLDGVSGTGTITTVTGVDVGDFGSTSATTFRGVEVSTQSSGLDDAYAIYIGDMNGASDSFGLYQIGTDRNYLSGRLGVGVSPGAGATGYLQVQDNNDTAITYGQEIDLVKTTSATKTAWVGLRIGQTLASGTVTDSRAIEVRQPINGTVTTSYGLYVNDMDASSTDSYGIYQAGSGDQNVFLGTMSINSTTLSAAEKLFVKDDTETGNTEGIIVQLEKNSIGVGAKSQWYGLQSDIQHTSSDAGTLYVGVGATSTINDTSASISDLFGFAFTTTLTDGSITRAAGYFAQPTVDLAKTIATYTAVQLESPSGSGTITTSTGIEVNDQGLSSTTTRGISVEAQTGTDALGIYCDDSIELTGTLVIGENADHTIAPAAGKGLIWVRNDTPSSLIYTDDAGNDIVLGAAGSSPWTTTGTVVHPSTITNSVSIGTTSAFGAENLYIFDNSTSGSREGIRIEMENLSGSSLAQFSGVIVALDNQAGAGNMNAYTSFDATLAHQSASTISTVKNYLASLTITDASGDVDDYYAFHAEAVGGSGTINDNAYGLYIGQMEQGGTTNPWGVYQASSSDGNYFAGQMQVGSSAGTISLQDNFHSISTLALGAAARAVRATLSKTASGVLNAGYPVYAEMNVTTGTLTAGSGVRVATPTGAGSALALDGVHIEAQKAGPAAGITAYGLYQAGSSDLNYFAGVTGIGVDPSGVSDTQLQVEYTSTSGTEDSAIVADIAKSGGGTTTDARSYYAQSSPAAGTVTNYHGLQVDTPSGAGAITSAHGLYVRDLDVTGGGATTNAYGVYIADQTATTLNYGIYQASSDDLNYFAGTVVGGKDETSPPSGTFFYGYETSASASMFRAGVETTGSITSVYGFRAEADVNSGHTLTTYQGVRIDEPTGSGTITDAYGIFIRDLANGPTIGSGTYAIYIEDQTDPGAVDSYAIYQEGEATKGAVLTTAVNYFGSRVGVNETAPSQNALVHVTDHKSSTSFTFTRAMYLAELDWEDTTNDKSSWRGFRASVSSDSGADVGTVVGFQMATTLSGDIGTWKGLQILTPSSGAAGGISARAIEIGDVSNIGGLGTFYSIYASGSSDVAYFAGDMGIKDSTPSYALDVNGDIRAQGQFVLPSYTVASLPTGITGGLIYVSDETGGAVPAFYDGSNWRRVTDRAIVS